MADGDFVADWQAPTGRPREWLVGPDNVWLGWRWERKEIENYLLDPSVVARALGGHAPDATAYLSALSAARDAIATYEAARCALAASRPRFPRLPSQFGRRRGGEKHAFPDDLSEEGCLQGIAETVGTHQGSQVLTVQHVEDRFRGFLGDFRPQGPRYGDYLTAFAGKDLCWGMEHALREMGFRGSADLRERVLLGITQATEDIGTWVPEWQALQAAVDAA